MTQQSIMANLFIWLVVRNILHYTLIKIPLNQHLSHLFWLAMFSYVLSNKQLIASCQEWLFTTCWRLRAREKRWPDFNGNSRILTQMETAVLEYLPTRLSHFWGMSTGKYSSAMVLIWVKCKLGSTIYFWPLFFCGDIPLQSPYIGPTYGRYLQCRNLKWPVISDR